MKLRIFQIIHLYFSFRESSKCMKALKSLLEDIKLQLLICPVFSFVIIIIIIIVLFFRAVLVSYQSGEEGIDISHTSPPPPHA